MVVMLAKPTPAPTFSITWRRGAKASPETNQRHHQDHVVAEIIDNQLHHQQRQASTTLTTRQIELITARDSIGNRIRIHQRRQRVAEIADLNTTKMIVATVPRAATHDDAGGASTAAGLRGSTSGIRYAAARSAPRPSRRLPYWRTSGVPVGWDSS